MKKITTLIILIITTVSFAQNRHKKADDLFNKMWYIKAAKQYESVIAKGDISMEVLQKTADAYYFSTNMEMANKWYEVLLSEYPNDIDGEYLFRYAQTLQSLGEYKSAKKWMNKFAEKAEENDIRAKNYNQKDLTVDVILTLEPQFTLKNLDLNTKYSDFAPMYYQNKLIYASAVDTSYYQKRTYRWNEQPFLNLYLARINPLQTNATTIREFSKEINTKYHEATVAFSPDQTKIYFTRNNYNGKLGRDNNGTNHLKLYSAIKQKNEDGEIVWTDIKELPFNSEEYSVGHPTVSKDGKKLYFVSDMPGSIGATDIFAVDILDNDQYSEPQNLGTTINTYGREMFPFITEKALYFASDGHLGIGGLDVFQSNFSNTNIFDIPVNLGPPLNSKRDDFGYIVNEETHTGFVCSNRKLGKGDDDVYSFERIKLPCKQKLEGLIIDEDTKVPLGNAIAKLINESGEIIQETLTTINGTFNFKENFPCNTNYKIEVAKENYKGNNVTIATTEIPDNTISTTIPIQKELNELIISDNGVLKIDIDIIYFDLNKWYIRDDAALELDKIVSIMNQYPKMIIKIEAHTDSRGSDSYNLKLSDRRAKSTRDYIILQGIDASRIQSAIGYGETQLINKCKNGVKCSNEEHDVNRRSEFIIISM